MNTTEIIKRNNHISVLNEKLEIKELIYEVRGKQIMLDSDLARLYKCKNGTKTINLAVKRHINRFPDRFMFQLTEEECKQISRFQFETLNKRGHNIKYLPYAFTEQGVAMLSAVLRTEVAEKVSVRIMDAFVEMKKYISNSLLEQKYINDLVLKHDIDIKILKNFFDKFKEKTNVNEIYFNGQIYDAYSKIKEIFNKANKKLIIIDNYADSTILDIIKRLEIDIIIITKTKSLLTKEDILKYNEQYHNLKIFYDDTFHDRYFILDESTLYHCGTSINKIGSKTFSINLISDIEICKSLINKVNDIIKNSV